MKFQTVADVEARLRSSKLTNRDLYSLWEQRQPVPEPARDKGKGDALDSTKQIPWLQGGLATAVEFAACALQKEEFLLVCDCAREALRLWGGHAASPEREPLVRLRMHYAAALDRLGYSSDARRQLDPCIAADFQPPLSPSLRADVLLQIGNILRDESVGAPLRAARDQMAGQALDFYLRALQVEPGRLEAEALATAAGFVISRPGSETRLAAEDRARRLLARAQASEQAAGRQYASAYFRAVAHAALGAPDEAAAAFGELAGLPGATTAHLADARFWARTLAEALELPSDHFRRAFPPLQLIVFSGHLPDPPDRLPRRARFPLHAAGEVGTMLAAALAEAQASVGMASAAAGADLLFVEALSRRPGAAFHLVLPWEQEEFRRTSIIPFEPAGDAPLWEPMFRGALERAATTRVIGQMYQPKDEAASRYTMEVTAGLALHSARAMRLDLHPMALWDGQLGDGSGGTASFVEFWRQLGYPPTVLPPPAPAAEIRAGVAPAPGPEIVPSTEARDEGPPVRSERDTLRQEVKTLLFADIVGYSKLTEVAVPQFIGLFMEAASQLTAASAHAPRFVNTWGDAICAVFDFAQDAGCYAMELIQLIRDNQEDWVVQGLGATETHADGRIETHPLNIRMGLHTGPVFLHYNPMVRQLAFTGVHVNRAARIEPVTPHGEVFASEEFTALAELDRVIRQRHPHARPAGRGKAANALSFTCEYAGSMTLAKGYPGWHRLYRVAPHRVFALEELAKVIHEDYCAKEAGKGHTAAQSPSLRPWEDLPETLRDANRAQAADIPNKLEALGYELAPSFGLPPASVVISDEQAAAFSAREHERWIQEKRRGGWSYGPERDNDRKLHPSMIPWQALSCEEKNKDRAAVQNVPRLIEKAGFRVRKIIRPLS